MPQSQQDQLYRAQKQSNLHGLQMQNHPRTNVGLDWGVDQWLAKQRQSLAFQEIHPYKTTAIFRKESAAVACKMHSLLRRYRDR